MVDLAAYFQNQIQHLAPSADALCVALSGGSDSWALALLARDYCQSHGLKLQTLTVDHRLRANSTEEAAQVEAECVRRGIPHATLVWQHDGVDTRRQERARAARYTLLGDWCATNGFPFVLTAHHADDQAETVLLRFCRGSGARGLAGMAPSRPLNHSVTLLRPLLDLPKAALEDFARQAGVPVAADPSNDDPAYARARLRAAWPVLAREGLTTATLLKAAAAARDEDAALDFATRKLLLDPLAWFPGEVSLPSEDWDAAPPALQQRAFLTIFRYIDEARFDPQPYPPERDAVARLCAALTGVPGNAGGRVRRTLGGVIATRTRDTVHFLQEGLPKNRF